MQNLENQKDKNNLFDIFITKIHQDKFKLTTVDVVNNFPRLFQDKEKI